MAEETITVSGMRTCYATYINTDLTEGRGSQYPRFICEKQTTATRLGIGADVQGSNGSVKPVAVFLFERRLYGPIKEIVCPTKEDERAEKLLEEKAEKERLFMESVEKARSLGLSETDLEILTSQIKN